MAHVLNPRLELDARIISTHRRLGRRIQTVARLGNEETFDAIAEAVQHPGAAVSPSHFSPEAFRHLRDLGVIIEAREVSAPVTFVCALRDEGELPSITGSTRWERNPRVWLQETPQLPAALTSVLSNLEAIDRRLPILWVESPLTGFVCPHHLTPEEAGAYQRLRRQGPRACDPQWLEVWRRAEVLFDPVATAEARKIWKRQLTTSRKELAQKQFTVLRQLLPANLLRAAPAYLARLDREGYLTKGGDEQEAFRESFHNEPLNRFVHAQINRVVTQVTPAPTKPSFCFFTFYKRGSRLKRHVDRPQCRWNMSLQLDARPATTPWPLGIEVDGKKHLITLGNGDGVIYSGFNLPHWRGPIPRGLTCGVCSFHFVDLDFTGSLD